MVTVDRALGPGQVTPDGEIVSAHPRGHLLTSGVVWIDIAELGNAQRHGWWPVDGWVSSVGLIKVARK